MSTSKRKRRRKLAAKQNAAEIKAHEIRETEASTAHKIAELRKPLGKRVAEAAAWSARVDPRDKRRNAPISPISPSREASPATRRLTERGEDARLEAEQRTERRRRAFEALDNPEAFLAKNQAADRKRAKAREKFCAKLARDRALGIPIALEEPKRDWFAERADADEGWYETEFEGMGAYDIGGT